MATLDTTEENTDTKEDTEESTKKNQKTFTEAQLAAILSRKETKWQKQMDELTSSLEELKVKYEKTSKQAEKGLTAEEKLENLMKEHKSIVSKLTQEKEQIISQYKNKQIETELLKNLADKVTRPKLALKILKDEVEMAEDGSIRGRKPQNDFDDPKSLSEIIETFVEDYPELRKAPKSGSGIKPEHAVSTANNNNRNKDNFSNINDYANFIANQMK